MPNLTKGGESRYVADTGLMRRLIDQGWSIEDDTVILSDDEGDSFAITNDGANVKDALDRNLRTRSAAQVKRDIQKGQASQRADAEEREYGGAADTVSSFFQGVGSSLTLGGTDWLNSKITDGRSDKVAKVNSTAYGVGRLGGELITLPLGFGNVSKLGTLGKIAAHTPGALVARVAGKAGQLVGRASPILGAVAEAAVESGLVAVGNKIGDSVINNDPLTLDALASSLTSGALFGGITGGALGATFKLAGKFKGASHLADDALNPVVSKAGRKSLSSKLDDVVRKVDDALLPGAKASGLADNALSGAAKGADNFIPSGSGGRVIEGLTDPVAAEGLKAARQELTESLGKRSLSEAVVKLDRLPTEQVVDIATKLDNVVKQAKPLGLADNFAEKLDGTLKEGVEKLNRMHIDDIKDGLGKLAEKLPEQLSPEAETILKLHVAAKTQRDMPGKGLGDLLKNPVSNMLNPVRAVGNVSAAASGVLDKAKDYGVKAALAASKPINRRVTTKVARRAFNGAVDALNLSFEDNTPVPNKPKEQIRAIKTLAANPQRIEQKVANTLAGMGGVSPEAQQHLGEAMLARIQFYAQEAPQEPDRSKFAPDNWKPDPGKVAVWNMKVRAGEDPIDATLGDFARGQLNAIAVSTVQTLYPALFAHIQQTLLTQFELLQAKLPYERRAQATLLGLVPLEPLANPNSVRRIRQVSQQAAAQTQGPGQGRTPQVGLVDQPQPTKGQRLADR